MVETLFNYQGIGQLIYKAAQAKDFPMLEAGVLMIGVVYMVATLVADLLLHRCSTRGCAHEGAAGEPGRRRIGASAGMRPQTRSPHAAGAAAPWRLLLRQPTFLAGAAILLFWVVCAILGTAIAPYRPARPEPAVRQHRRRRRRTGSAPTSSAATCSRGSSPGRGTS